MCLSWVNFFEGKEMASGPVGGKTKPPLLGCIMDFLCFFLSHSSFVCGETETPSRDCFESEL